MNKKTVAKQNPMAEYVYLTREDEGTDDEYYVVETSVEGISEGKIVGIYKLTDMKTMVVKTELV